MARIRASTNYAVQPLSDAWQLTELERTPNAAPASPADVAQLGLEWTNALVPGTVASALRARKAWDWSSTRNFDGSEWWYRVSFQGEPCRAGEALFLELDGLATLADVWLNGTHLLHSDNMFVAHELDVSSVVGSQNELYLRFSSLDVASSARRPRPRYKTRLIDRQQLRWFRTTLLGRMPGWTPPVTAVGPWRAVRLVRRRSFSVRGAKVRARVESGRALVRAELELATFGVGIESAVLHVGQQHATLVAQDETSLRFATELEVVNAQRWWPRGYGEQPRYPAHIVLTTSNGETHELALDALAFREVRLDTEAGRFALWVNDVEIRCRGACWTPSDVVSLQDDALTAATLQQAQAAGMNMLRVGGTMIYESDAFYEECDRSGIMVWQDFMFANCDYPIEDTDFCANVAREAEEFLDRSETRACLLMLCGSSEVEQQVAMLGLPRETWKSALYEELLRGLARNRRPDVPYVTSTPSGGELPFQANAGVTHYYGVGAYLRPLEDARRADVKFAAECLAFANIPEESTLVAVLGDVAAPFHHPRWKARTPRDNGAGWDFDDVRDHYTKLLFGVDSNTLRYEDPSRALALGRVTSGEVMARTLAEWRRPQSNTRGALIWLLRDLWPGAGWGLIDSLGVPKAAYYYVQRAMQPRAVFLADEGLNGLSLCVTNDCEQSFHAEVQVQLIRNGSLRIATGSAHLDVPGRSALDLNCATLFDHFIDLTHAYRFGPRSYDVAIATLRETDGGDVSQACHFPGGLTVERSEDLGLEASVHWVSGDTWQLRVSSARFAHAVAVDVPGFALQDSYFSVPPGSSRTIELRAAIAGATPRGFVQPLNAQGPTRISAAPRTP